MKRRLFDLIWVLGAFYAMIAAAMPARADFVFLREKIHRGANGFIDNSTTQSVSINDGPYQFRPDAELAVLSPDGKIRTIEPRGMIDFDITDKGRGVIGSVQVRDAAGKLLRTEIVHWNLDTGARKVLFANGAIIQSVVDVSSDGRMAFITNVDGWQSPKAGYPLLITYAVDRDGANLEQINHMDLGGVFGLFCNPQDGRLYYTTGQNQGRKPRAGMRWNIWSHLADGGDFRPEQTPFGADPNFTPPYDFPVITSDGTLVCSVYYNTRVYGRLSCAPLIQAEPHQPVGKFLDELWTMNPRIPNGNNGEGNAKITSAYGWMRNGEYSPCEWATDGDVPNFQERDGIRGFTAGDELRPMLSHPYPGVDGVVYVTSTGTKHLPHPQNPAIRLEDRNLGIYMISRRDEMIDGKTIKRLRADKPADMIKVIDSEEYHEWMGKLAIEDKEIWGQNLGAASECKKDPDILGGEPFGTIGTSATNVIEIIAEIKQDNPGPQVVEIKEDDVEYARLIGMAPTRFRGAGGGFPVSLGGSPFIGTERPFNYEGLLSEANERLGIFDIDIPVKKWRGKDGKLYVGPVHPADAERIKRKDGKWDTSIKCQIPCNMAWSIQLLDIKKRVLGGLYKSSYQDRPLEKTYKGGATMAETWHQVRAGEAKWDCQGCHAHNEPDKVSFEDTLAASDEYPNYRLTALRTLTFEEDIAPLNLGIEKQPWNNPAKYHEMYGFTLGDSLPASVPDAVRAKVYDWQGTAMMSSNVKNGQPIGATMLEGANIWTGKPSLVISQDMRFIGAIQPANGIKSIVAKADGVDISNQLPWDPKTWRYGVPTSLSPTVLDVTITDQHGMVSRLVRTRKTKPTDPPPPPDPTPVDPPTGRFLAYEDGVGEFRATEADGKLDYLALIEGMTRDPLFVDIRAGDDPNVVTWGDRAVGENPGNGGLGTSWIIKMDPRLKRDAQGRMKIWAAMRPGRTFAELRVYLNYTEKGTGGVRGVDFDLVRVAVPPMQSTDQIIAELKAQLAAMQLQLTTATAQVTALTAERDALKLQGTSDAATIKAISDLNRELSEKRALVKTLSEGIKAANDSVLNAVK